MLTCTSVKQRGIFLVFLNTKINSDETTYCFKHFTFCKQLFL